MIIDYVPKELSNTLLEILESDSIPWAFSKESVADINTENYYDSPQFTYTMIEGDYSGNISSHTNSNIHRLWNFIYKAHPEAFENFIKLSRIKCNMLTRGANENPHVPHLDRYTPHTVIIYYVNTSDGDTYIYNETDTIKITPEQGKYIIFDGSLKHCGSSPVSQNHRIVINFNF